jgi:hypothetical protein
MGRIEFSVAYNFESIFYQNLEHSGGEGLETRLLNRSSGRNYAFDRLLLAERSQIQ